MKTGGRKVEVVRELREPDRSTIASVAAVAIVRSRAFMHHRTWPHAILVLMPDAKPRVTSRVDFAAWLRANDLHDQAAEVLRTRTRPRELLMFWLGDTDVGIVTLDLRGAFT